MKTISTSLLTGCIFLIFSCQSPNQKAGEFRLLPQPVSFEISGTSQISSGEVIHYYALNEIDLPVCGDLLKGIQPAKNEHDAQVVFQIDESVDLEPEGYTLEISDQQISITGKDRPGLLYAFMTLEQLMEDAEDQDVPLPLCSIRDYPLLPYRAIHLDIKHHREKTDYYYGLLDQLAGYKVNAIIVEMEDKLTYERQPEVGSADALSIAQWRELGDYAMERNIEISPLIQGLGHASFILKHDKYKDIRDDPESDWAFNPVDPKTYDVQFDLYLDALEATPHGRYLHVGGDEVHTTGRESGKSPLELQLIWLDKVCRFAEDHGRIPIFWDDMPLKHAEVYRPMFNTEIAGAEVDKLWEENEHRLIDFLDQFPKNCIYMRWNYSTPQTYGNIKAMEWFTENGLQVMGATAGQTRWALMPQNESNMENIRSFAMTSIEMELDGLFLTLWDDDSPHFELYMRGILAFAEYAWSGDRRKKDEIKSAYRHRELSSSLAGGEFAFIDQLEGPVAFWNNVLLKKGDRRRLRKMSNPIQDAIIDLPAKGKSGEWSTQYADLLERSAEVLKACESIDEIITGLKKEAVRNHYRLEVYEQVNTLVSFSARALLTLQTYDNAQNEQEEAEALTQIQKLSGEFSTLRNQLEQVYGQTRIITKPEGYLLDQDHHNHLANQSTSFDWQFIAEILFLEKLEMEF